MNQEILEGVPTGRDPWSLAKLIPGVQVATYDVGGTQSMQQSSLSAHGSNTNDVSYNIDGATVNWPGGGGGATMMYYDQGMFEEVNYMTSAIPAEMLAGGVSINMVTKDGGNQWRGNVRYNFSNDDLQSENWSGRAAARADLPRQPDQEDLRLQPVGRRRHRPEPGVGQRHHPQVGREQAGERRATTTARRRSTTTTLKNYSGKVVGQLTPNHKFVVSLLLERQDSRPPPRQQRPHSGHRVGRADQPGADDAGEVHGHSRPHGVRVELQRDGRPDQLHLSARHRAERDPQHRHRHDARSSSRRRAKSTSRTRATSSTTSFTYTKSGWGGEHLFKTGVQWGRLYYESDYSVLGDHWLVYNNGRRRRCASSTRRRSRRTSRKVTGFFFQDAWSMNRLTFNIGGRWDKYVGKLPEQSTPGGRFAGPRTRARSRKCINQVDRRLARRRVV